MSELELQEDLKVAEEQLSAVEELLKEDPENDELRESYESLLEMVKESRRLLVVDEQQKEDLEQQPPAKVARYNDEPVQVSTNTRKFRVGERVEVVSGTRVYSAVISAVLPADSNTGETQYRLKYYEFEAEVTLDGTQLRPLKQYVPEGMSEQEVSDADLWVGAVCQARYATDNQWYEARIVGLTQFGFNIEYSAYGTKEEVPREYLAPSDKTNNVTTKSKPALAPVVSAPKLIAVPENLKVLPTDTEEEALRKRKKLKSIKSKNKIIEQEQASAQSASSWQKFVSKSAKRSGFK